MTTQRPQVYLELTKPRITLMVLVTVAAGFCLATPAATSTLVLIHVLVGTGLSCSGSGALNQYLERESDGIMDRTRFRPLPTRKVSPSTVLALGVALSVGGVAYLAINVNFLTAALDALTVTAYLFVYTPLKPISPLATLVGAVPGALPPLMGWTAAHGSIGTGGVLLFSILFLWQIPHFLAIGRLYRNDYSQAGFPMLASLDSDGRMAGRQMVLYSVALLPVSLMATTVGLSGPVYFWSALVLGTAYTTASLMAASSNSRKWARRLLLTSVVYLPLLLAVMLIDRTTT
jgi:protoheme IX farnesyltransferase